MPSRIISDRERLSVGTVLTDIMHPEGNVPVGPFPTNEMHPVWTLIVTTPTQPKLNSKVGFDMKMTLDHHHSNSISLKAQLFLTQFKPDSKGRFMGSTTTITTTPWTTTTITTTKTTKTTFHLDPILTKP